MTRTRFASAAAALLAAVAFVSPPPPIRRAADRRAANPVAALEHRRRAGVRADAGHGAAAAVAHLRHPARRHPRRAQRHRPPLRAVHARPRRGAGRLARRRRRHRRARGAGGAGPRPGRARRGRLLPARSSAITEGPAKAAGIAVGRAAAQATLNRRATRWRRRRDAAGLRPEGRRRRLPVHRAVRPRASCPAGAGAAVRRSSSRDHRLDGPLPRHRAGSTRATSRTCKAIGALDQHHADGANSRQIAQFWYEDSPLGWNRIANTVMRQRELDSWARGARVRAGQLRASPTATSPASRPSTTSASGGR